MQIQYIRSGRRAARDKGTIRSKNILTVKSENKNEDKPKPDDNCRRQTRRNRAKPGREFLKGLTTGTVAISALGVRRSSSGDPSKTRGATNTTTVVPFAVSVRTVVSTLGGKVINIEGDPGHPVAKALCAAEGAAACRW